jgi:uncharacterized protein
LIQPINRLTTKDTMKDHIPKLAVIKDTLQNLVSNMNTAKDKKNSTTFTAKKFTPTALEAMYSDDWLAGKIVDIPVDDSFRKWRYFDCPSLEDKLELIYELESTLLVKERFIEASKWSRLYGGSILVMGVENQGTFDTPLNIEAIRQGDLKYILCLAIPELNVSDVNIFDIEKPNFRLPEYYTTLDGKKIHYTRVIRFDGLKTPWQVRQCNNYWNISILQRVYDAIIQAQSVSDNVNSMVYESTVDVIKIPDLFSMLASKNGESRIMNRFGLANVLKGINNMLLLDSKEEYAKVSNTFTGLGDLIQRYLAIASAASDIPATRLLGQAPNGLNATGESDMNNYDDMIQSNQENNIRPKLALLDKVLVRSAIGNYPDDWSFKFEALRQMTELQRADLDLKNAQRDKIYIDGAILEPSIIAKQLKTDETYQHIEDDYIDSLDQLSKEEKVAPSAPIPTLTNKNNANQLT